MRWTPLRKAILMVLAQNSPMTRDDICSRLGLGKHLLKYIQAYPQKRQRKSSYYVDVEQYNKRTTIYDNLAYMEREGRVERFHTPTNKVGRPKIYWRYKQ